MDQASPGVHRSPRRRRLGPQLTAALSTRPSVRIAYAALGSGSAPIWAAHEAGLFVAEGLDVELAFIRGSRAVVDALLEGSVHFGNFAAPAVVEANLRGADLVYLTGGLNYLVQSLITRSEIREPGGLRGHTLGAGDPGDPQNNLLRRLLALHGLVLGRDVHTRQVSNQPDAIAEMNAGNLDGAMFSPPYSFLAAKSGHRVLMEGAAHRIEYQLGGIVARRAYVHAHPDITEKVVKAYVRGIHYFKTHPDEGAQVFCKYSLLDDEDVAHQTWAALNGYLSPAPYPTVEGIRAVMENLAESGSGPAVLDPETMADLRWVRHLEDEGFIRDLYGSKSGAL